MTEDQMWLVKQLREETGQGIMFCKKALYKANFDYTKAKNYLKNSNYGKLTTL